VADDLVTEFAQEWFDELSQRAPAPALLARVRDEDLEMVFPERTLRSHDDFAAWYRDVGELYSDQTHVIERLVDHDHGDHVDVEVTVVWAAVDRADGRPFAFRVNQEWTLNRDPDGRLRIRRYRVLDATPAETAAAPAGGRETR
jgi:hypothetical protein